MNSQYNLAMVSGSIDFGTEKVPDYNAVRNAFYDSGFNRKKVKRELNLKRFMSIKVDDSPVFNLLLNNDKAELVEFIVDGKVQDSLKIPITKKDLSASNLDLCDPEYVERYCFLLKDCEISKIKEMTVRIYGKKECDDYTSKIFFYNEYDEEITDRVIFGYFNDMIIEAYAGHNLINIFFVNPDDEIKVDVALYRLLERKNESGQRMMLKISSFSLNKCFTVIDNLSYGDYVVVSRCMFGNSMIKQENEVTLSQN